MKRDFLSRSLSLNPSSTSPPAGSPLNGKPRSEDQVPGPAHSNTPTDPYGAVVLALMAVSIIGVIAAFVAEETVGNPVLFDVAITLLIVTGVLTGVDIAQAARSRPAHPEGVSIGTEKDAPDSPEKLNWKIHLARVRGWVQQRLQVLGAIRIARVGTAIAGAVAIGLELFYTPDISSPAPLVAGIAAATCVAAAGLAALVARYFQGINSARLPESAGLRRGARVVAWILLLAAASIGLAWARFNTVLQVLHYVFIAINFAACYGLFWVKQPPGEPVFPLDLDVLTILGSRNNIVASVLDTAERQLGIDLRSTWALTVVRRSVEPLAIGLLFVAWFSTSLTVVGMQEEGLVERLGAAVGGQPLQPGLHLHWPWPIDRVFRIPVRRIQTATVGYAGEKKAGPDSVLWAVEHAPNEYTLLLGNGRDLITVDATVQFRIADARAWRYHTQNPADALRAIAYRAVMRSTVNRTLSETLSENVVTLTGRMRDMVQQDANALGLGVEIVAFTVGGMHPPVAVAPDYQAVVSAEIAKVTAVVNAQAFHNETVPAAEASVLKRGNTARADGIKNLAQAAGEAWSFRTVESQYRAAPQEYFFRRRLEALENGLSGLRYTVVDSRFQRDGGELWLIP